MGHFGLLIEMNSVPAAAIPAVAALVAAGSGSCRLYGCGGGSNNPEQSFCEGGNQQGLFSFVSQFFPASSLRGKRSALYLSSGPSGAGKDTLLLGARTALAAEGDEEVRFLQRHITRPQDKCTDLEISVSEEEFQRLSKAGHFAFEWHAHNTHYGIGAEALQQGFQEGKRLVANVSRTIIDKAREDFGQDHEVYCLLITADDDVLRQRLMARGRESEEEVGKRIARAKALEPKGDHVVTVKNMASVDKGVMLVKNALKGQLRYSLWLEPSLSDPVRGSIQRSITSLAEQHNTRPFGPHVTLCPTFITTQQEAIGLANSIAEALPSSLKAGFEGVGSEQKWNKCLYLHVDSTSSPGLAQASLTASKIIDAALGTDAAKKAPAYHPHMSLLYSVLDQASLSAALAEVETHTDVSASAFHATDLVLTMTSPGEDTHCWIEVCRIPLSAQPGNIK